MLRYDYIYIHSSNFKDLSEDELDELWGLEFQTRGLDREFLTYRISWDKTLYFQDYHYDLVDNIDKDGLFSKSLKVVKDAMKRSYFTGVFRFYGKPYEEMYIFDAKFNNGELEEIKLIKKI